MKAMNALFRAGAAAGLLALTSSAAFAQQVQLSIKDGRVTLKTENATVRQILDEWTRVGQTRIVNADKVTGQPLTLTLIDVPEREALDTVMRQAAGYAVVERATDVANASMFDRILVVARTTPVTQVASSGAGSSASSNVSTYTPPAEPAEEQVALAEEPPPPAAPVVNPYQPNGGQGAPGAVGPNGMANGANANAAAGATVGVNPPVKFDYTNPQAYFEQQRRAQQAAAQAAGQTTGQPGQVNPQPQQFINPYPGSNVAPIAVGGSGTAQPSQPSNVPTFGTGTTNAPGAAPAPQPAQPPSGTGSNFNPYNMSGYTPPANAGQAPPATPVEPDRSKYANPYQPTRTP